MAGLGVVKGFRPKGVGNWMDALEAAIRGRTDSPETLKRARSIVEAMPQVAEVYSPDAVGRAATYSPPRQLTTATPRQFLELAHPLDIDAETRRLLDYYKDTVQAGENLPPPKDMFSGWYEQELKDRVGKPYMGFSDIPYLDLRKVPGSTVPQIKGHEGRHRNQVLSELYGKDVPFLLRWYDGAYSLPLPDNPTTLIRNEPSTAMEFFRPAARFAGGGLARVAAALGAGAAAGYSPDSEAVVKLPGGNWLAGSVERALKGLKRSATGYGYDAPEEVIAMLDKRWSPEAVAKLREHSPDLAAQVDQSYAMLRPKAAINSFLDRRIMDPRATREAISPADWYSYRRDVLRAKKKGGLVQIQEHHRRAA